MADSYKCQALAKLRSLNKVAPPWRARRRKLVDWSIVLRVWPRTSKGITDLLLLNLVALVTCPVPLRSHSIYHSVVSGATDPMQQSDCCQPPPQVAAAVVICPLRVLVSKPESRSLSQLSRQITPPTKNGHAPPLV